MGKITVGPAKKKRSFRRKRIFFTYICRRLGFLAGGSFEEEEEEKEEMRKNQN